MAIPTADALAALRDPAYHRHLMFRRVDSVLERQLGRELEPHEAQSKLRGPQLSIVRRIERAIAARAGEKISVLMARQTGKNEIEGFLETRALRVWCGIPGSTWVRTAPTHKPQIVNSKLRLEKHLLCDPLIAGRYRKREGYIYELGKAQVHFLSGGRTAQVVGDTASIALSVDEAHKIDRDKFEEDFAPFTASTNAPTILWGVAAAKQDLLHRYREEARGTDRVMVFPAAVWCELSKPYAGHYETRRRELGADHPVILTQYDLVPVEAIGAYLNPAQRAALFAGDHPRLEAPRAGMSYGILVDIGGEVEYEADSDEVRELEPGRDSTQVLIVEWDPRAPQEPYPVTRIVNALTWTGKQHEAAGPEIVKLCHHWRVGVGAIDAVGVGEATAGYVSRRVPAVAPYKATSTTVSEDCFDLLARLNCGTITAWRADTAADAELRELEAQSRHTRYEIRGHTKMRLKKPTGIGTSDLHIDMVKALTYARLVVGRAPYSGLLGWMEQKAEAARAAREARKS
jgi:hypothetical protein